MVSSQILGVVVALSCAAAWGTADFSGGVAARRSHPFQVLALASISGGAALVTLAIVVGEQIPPPAIAAVAAVAGVFGVVGLSALYRGLALGNAAVVAPTSAVVGAVVPVLFGIVSQGNPKPSQLAGFLAAVVGISLVTRADRGESSVERRALSLAVLAGVGFGIFFVLLARIEPGGVFAPLAIAKGVSLVSAVLILGAQRVALPHPAHNRAALMAGVLDASGNACFVVAAWLTRLDVVAVLSSMYPASTVFLASVLLRQTIAPAQWLGIGLCLAAVALVAV